jgi:chitodextrinase/ubiquinone biosynthesis protein Coq4
MRVGLRHRLFTGVTGGLTVVALLGALASPAAAAKPPPKPDTVIDSAPASLTTSTTATFTFHSTITPATFTCKLDAGTSQACTSPRTYSALTSGSHTFSVFATANGIADGSPATASWAVDTTPPTVPTNLAAVASRAPSVALTWTASTDANGVAGYDVFRNAAQIASVGAVTSYTDTTVAGGTTYTYAVRARDTVGNTSALSTSVTTTTPAAYDSRLTRSPYLTDLVGLNAIVNFGTDRSDGSASVIYGAVTSGTCSLTTTATASRSTISVNGIFEYQWKANLVLPATGTYCYRPYLGPVDLLGLNASPQFNTQVPLGSLQTFSFAVFGDWGQVDATGQNPDQANVMKQIAKSGVNFAVTTGDNGYVSGSQGNYGDLQQVGADTSAIFGPAMWASVGASTALFPVIGNHGLARSDVNHPHLTNWPQDAAVATSGGRYQKDTYCCVNGSASAVYPSPWYAFDAGTARFYILDAAWADLNTGTAGPYPNDYAAHWTPTSPEYQWLLADLNAHPSGLKFAFFHYPLYADDTAAEESSDTSLQGNSSLEGLLASKGVNLAFSGHAHIYERNNARTGTGVLSLPSYTTGGGGGDVQSISSTCSANDAYAIGWSDTSGTGNRCGAAPIPTARSQVFHFLKVTVAGSTVTVTPTDSTGRTFDVKSYTFKPLPDTYIDTPAVAGSTSTTATFQFHASGSPATFTCKLDGAAAKSCTSPITYTNLAQGQHTFSVFATVNKVNDPLPATRTWTVDFTPPTTPSGFTAAATSPFAVSLHWNAATDNTGVTGYDILRDGTTIATIPPGTSYVDTAVVGSTTHQYAVRARDIAGNLSVATPTISVTTPPPPIPVFADGFESGDLSLWTSSGGLTPETTLVHAGTTAVEGNTVNGGTFARETLPATYSDAYARVFFDVVSQTDQINLIRLRDAAGNSLGYAYLNVDGALAFHNDTTNTNDFSATTPGPGWHALELHMGINGAAGTVEVWLDNTLITDLTVVGAVDLGTAPVGQFQIGELQTARVYDVVLDDAAFGTARLGPVADGAKPSAPTGVTAAATSAFSVNVSWQPSTDNAAVVGYDVFRDGFQVGSVSAPTTSFTDASALPQTTYGYTVRARDASNNVSVLSTSASATTPAATPPLFGDGFESGTLAAWTSSSGLTPESTDVRTGSVSVEGNTSNGNTVARKTLSSTYANGYGRLAFEIKSQTSQVNLLRMRDAAGNSLGFVYVSVGGHLGFHNDALNTNTSSGVVVGPGWHVIELHLGINGAAGTVEVWLDSALVGDLSVVGAANLGTAPVGQFQIGDAQTGLVYDVVFDDAAFGSTRVGPVADGAAPSVPTGVSAVETSPFSVAVSWSPSTDNVGVAAYDLFRDGAAIGSVAGSTTSFTDTTALASTTYGYTVRARDASNNVSAASAVASVTTPPPATLVFADGFESGTLAAWTSSSGLTPENTDARTGSYAVEGNTANGNTVARETLSATYLDAYARVGFEMKSQVSQVNLLRMRDAAGNSLGYVYLSAGGHLGFHDDATATNTSSATVAGPGWHALELHMGINGTAGTVEVWLDGVRVDDLSLMGGVNLGTVPVGQFQIGDAQAGLAYDVVFDDAAFGSARLGPVADGTAPSVPTAVTAVATSPFSVAVGWSASTDDVQVAGYDVFRDGVMIGSVSVPATSFTDQSVLASTTYGYSVRARDTSNNVSATSASTPVTTPAAGTPVFADGFESGTLAAWTSSSGLTPENTDARTGAFAVEGNTANGNTVARKTLSSTFTDGYARVGFELKSQSSQVNLLRMRDAAGNSLGFVYVSAGGHLGFHNDALNTNTSSAVVVGPGWHLLELHLGINGTAGTVEVWLDSTLVGDLSAAGTANLGTAPVGQFQIGDAQTGLVYDVVFDDAAFGSARLGPVADGAPPSVPTAVTAVATTAFSVNVGWSPSTDNVGVTSYDVFRDGALIGTVDGSTTSLTDSSTLASTTYGYTVRARDGANNVSAPSAVASVTTPAAGTPVFADGFESGTLAAWTSSAGLTPENTDARTGSYAVEGNTSNGNTVARETLASTYADGYGRVAFEMKSQVSQVNLMRMRDAAGNSLGYVYLSAGAHLGFHNDALNTNISSATTVGPGWHVLELHLGINGAAGTVEVWLDNVRIADLSNVGTVNLGSAPVGQFQIGDAQAGLAYDVVFDDAAFGSARLGLVADGSAPSVPTGVSAVASSPFSVAVGWSPSTDDVGVAGYDVLRDGVVIGSVDGSTTSFTDNSTLASTTYGYTVRARDGANNVSAPSAVASVTTPPPGTPVFADGFESGTLAAWTSSSGLTPENTDARTGSFAVEGNTANGNTIARKTLSSTFTDGYGRVGFEIKSQSSQVNLLRMRDAAGNSLGYVYVSAGGHLGFHNDALNTNTASATTVGPGWHVLELHLGINGTAGTVEVWLDSTLVGDLSAVGTANLGSAPVGQFQIGDAQTGLVYDVVFDDAAFGSARLGAVADGSAPSVPSGVGAVASSAFSVVVSWAPSTDDVQVTGYDVFRNGVVIASVGGSTTSFTDGSVSASTAYGYTVRARDGANNVSAQSASAPVSTPAPPVPVFADGFESGNLSAWTSSAGLVVENTDARTGSFAVEGNTTNGNTLARKTLGSTFTDGYGRVGFEIKSQSSQVNLLRMRDAAGNSLGYVYVSTNGALGFHNDLLNTNTPSATTVGAGWHVLELHLGINGTAGTVEVWLDSTLVGDLSAVGTANLGSAPVGQLQIGEAQTARTYDVVLDDAAFGSARLGPVADGAAPSVPTGVSAVATSPFSVGITWSPSTDDIQLAGYDVLRDGVVIASVSSATTSFTDGSTLGSTTYGYTVRARDASNNVSAQSAISSVTTPAAPIPVFGDGFESGDLSAWTSNAGLVVEGTDVRTGGFAAEGNTTNGNTFARKTLPSAYVDGYARLGFELKSQASQVNLLRFRDAAGNSIGYLYVNTAGALGFHDDALNTNTLSATTVGAGWHALELHLGINGTGGTVDVWLDNVRIADLSNVGAANLGTAPVGQLQIGEAQTARTYDVVLDDAAFGTARLGPVADGAAPSVPTGVSAVATSPFSVAVGWSPSTDDVQVTGYDVLRNGVVIASVDDATTSYADGSTLPSTTYGYTVRARDAANNVSAQSASAPVTTPAAATPVFADGFESGNLSAWTSSAGLVIEGTDVRTGAFAAEGNTTNGNTFARKTLGASYSNAYARLGFELKSQASQVNLLRLRDAAGNSIGYLYVSTAGKLSFHSDTLNTNTVSATSVGSGWHALEFHLGINGTAGTVEVWLDNVRIADLSNVGAANLGNAAVGQLQIGETQTARTYDVVFDDAAFGTDRLGP